MTIEEYLEITDGVSYLDLFKRMTRYYQAVWDAISLILYFPMHELSDVRLGDASDIARHYSRINMCMWELLDEMCSLSGGPAVLSYPRMTGSVWVHGLSGYFSRSTVQTGASAELARKISEALSKALQLESGFPSEEAMDYPAGSVRKIAKKIGSPSPDALSKSDFEGYLAAVEHFLLHGGDAPTRPWLVIDHLKLSFPPTVETRDVELPGKPQSPLKTFVNEEGETVVRWDILQAAERMMDVCVLVQPRVYRENAIQSLGMQREKLTGLPTDEYEMLSADLKRLGPGALLPGMWLLKYQRAKVAKEGKLFGQGAGTSPLHSFPLFVRTLKGLSEDSPVLLSYLDRQRERLRERFLKG